MPRDERLFSHIFNFRGGLNKILETECAIVEIVLSDAGFWNMCLIHNKDPNTTNRITDGGVVFKRKIAVT